MAIKFESVPPGQQPRMTKHSVLIVSILNIAANPYATNGMTKNWTTVAIVAPTGFFANFQILAGSIVTPSPSMRNTKERIIKILEIVWVGLKTGLIICSQTINTLLNVSFSRPWESGKKSPSRTASHSSPKYAVVAVNYQTIYFFTDLHIYCIIGDQQFSGFSSVF